MSCNTLHDIFFCLPGFTLGNVITSYESEKHVLEGTNVSLSCNYSGVVYNLLWYRQFQRSKPDLLLSITETGNAVKTDPLAHWLSAKVYKDTKVVKLEISPAKITDSSQYYCAVTPTITGNNCLLHKNFL